jgi:hypothetical protein
LSKRANIFANFFGENIFKIMISVTLVEGERRGVATEATDLRPALKKWAWERFFCRSVTRAFVSVWKIIGLVFLLL